MNIIVFDFLFHHRDHQVNFRRRMSLLDRIHTNSNDEQDRYLLDQLKFYARKTKIIDLQSFINDNKLEHTAMA